MTVLIGAVLIGAVLVGGEALARGLLDAGHDPESKGAQFSPRCTFLASFFSACSRFFACC